MMHWYRVVMLATAAGMIALGSAAAQEDQLDLPPATADNESAGLEDLNEALRVRISGEGVQPISRVIDLLQSALDQGLDLEDADFAENMLSDALMQRTSILMQVIFSRSILNPKVQQVRQLMVSDLGRVKACDDPPPLADFILGRLMALPGGDPHQARRSLTDFLETEEIPIEQRAEALVLRASLLKDEERALEDLDEAIRLVPGNNNFQIARAVLLRTHSKSEEALNVVAEILEQTPDDANAVILQGEIFRQLGRAEEALASFDQATALAPRAPGPYQQRGEIYLTQQAFDEAAKQFTKVLELQPGVLMTIVQRAQAYLLAGNLEAALADVEVVLQKQSLIAAHRIRAEILSKMNRLSEAIEEMEKLADAMPDQPELKMQLALYYVFDSQPRAAIAAYDKVLEVDQDNFNALRGRGDAYLNIGEHSEAVPDFERALRLQPKDPSLLNNLAWVLATSPEREVRDGQRAVELATMACELTDYETPHILSTLAASFAELGNFETAIKWSQQAVDMDDPENGPQLEKELASYREGQPWREKQLVTERKDSSNQPLIETPQSIDF